MATARRQASAAASERSGHTPAPACTTTAAGLTAPVLRAQPSASGALQEIARPLGPAPAQFHMLEAQWPLFGLRILTPRLEIRMPGDHDLEGLLAVAAEGIHDPDTMPFLHPWTDAEPAERDRSSLQSWWRARAGWSQDNWHFSGAVFLDGCPVGRQDLMAEHFAELRVVKTGSWLGQRFQGQGIGKEMRAAVLHFAFEGLGAMEAESGAWHDNAASVAVSRALGCRQVEGGLALRRGQPDRLTNFLLTREEWLARRRDDITIEGLDRCLFVFGVRQEAEGSF